MEIRDFSELLEAAKKEGIVRFVVGGIIKRQKNGEWQVLILKRIANDFMGGIEELPSGKVERGESLPEALSREVKEETKLSIQLNIRYLSYFDYFSSKGIKTRQFNFIVNEYQGKVKILEQEHSAYRWISESEIGGSQLTANIKKLLQSNRQQ